MHKFHNDLPFLTGRMKIRKVRKLVNLYDKNEYGIDIRNLKQALNHGSVSKKVFWNKTQEMW